MKKALLTLFLLVIAMFTNAQSITNVNFETKDKKIEVTYDITGAKKGQKFNITLWKSENNGSYTRLTRNITGDYGSFTPSYNGNFTNRKITWDVLAARKKLDAKVQFEVRASVKDPVPANFVFVQGGTFQMGSNDGYGDEQPVHSVTVSSFYISKYEVTFAEYDKFCDATGRSKPDDEGWGRGNRPVINVSWNDATAYCQWLSQKTGQTYRLPTEAEWEYAAGGGQNSPLTKGAGGIISLTKWAGTNSESSLGSYAWYWDNSGHKTHPVGTKSPNSLGIYDMSGNVWEWCNDWYDSYPSSSQTNPTGASSGSISVYRGGSWFYRAANCRVANRCYYTPSNSNDFVGFRVVRND